LRTQIDKAKLLKETFKQEEFEIDCVGLVRLKMKLVLNVEEFSSSLLAIYEKSISDELQLPDDENITWNSKAKDGSELKNFNLDVYGIRKIKTI
jgi:hypothetical protein